MKLQKITDPEYYFSLVRRYLQKGSVSNNYMMPQEVVSLIREDRVSEYHDEVNLYIFVDNPGNCSRVYFILNDLSNTLKIDDSIILVSEILFRGNGSAPEIEIDFLERSGFQTNLRRDQLCATTPHNDVIEVEYARNIEDAHEAIALINASFDHYSGDFIPFDKAEYLFENKELICGYDEHGHLTGVLHVSMKGKVAWVSHLVVQSNCRGQQVGSRLMRMFIRYAEEHGANRMMLWVQHDNYKALSLYGKYGFTYTNKSTISLIKDNGRIIDTTQGHSS